MAPRTKRLVVLALAVLPLVMVACGEDPTESEIQATSASSGASETASTSASASPAPAAASPAPTTTTTAAASMSPDTSSSGALVASGGAFGSTACKTVTEATETISGIKFQQPSLTIKPCTRVTVMNTDKTRHSVTFKGGPVEVTGIDVIEPGQSGTFLITEAGTYHFQCNFHAQMKLTVTAA